MSSRLSEEVEEGEETPRRDIEVIKARLKVAEAHYYEHYGKGANK